MSLLTVELLRILQSVVLLPSLTLFSFSFLSFAWVLGGPVKVDGYRSVDQGGPFPAK